MFNSGKSMDDVILLETFILFAFIVVKDSAFIILNQPDLFIDVNFSSACGISCGQLATFCRFFNVGLIGLIVNLRCNGYFLLQFVI